MAERICRGLQKFVSVQIDVLVFQLSYLVSAVGTLVTEHGLGFNSYTKLPNSILNSYS